MPSSVSFCSTAAASVDLPDPESPVHQIVAPPLRRTAPACQVTSRVKRSGGVDAALVLGQAGPAAAAPGRGDGAVRAADRAVALVVQRVVGHTVLEEVRPHLLLVPVGQRV